jgi:hypothetical protein
MVKQAKKFLKSQLGGSGQGPQAPPEPPPIVLDERMRISEADYFVRNILNDLILIANLTRFVTMLLTKFIACLTLA